MIKILIVADLPDELGRAWCQHVRDFDVSHFGCHFTITALAPDKTVKELGEILDVKPPLQHKTIIEHKVQAPITIVRDRKS